MLINFPSQNGTYDVETIEVQTPVVVVGANGSGKSRFGHWVANKHTQIAHLVSAQRLLQLSQLGQRLTLERATAELNSQKLVAVTLPQGDYTHLLQVLFAKDEERNRKYVELSKSDNSDARLDVPASPLDKLQKIWKEVLPHRILKCTENKVEVEFGETHYNGSEMSDGERVAFYLIGKCLIVPEQSIIIIDEPELHLHRALMSAVWNKIEEERNDCQFIYITHDLDFASSRTKAKKIWLKSFAPDNGWIWEDIPEMDEIPESLVLEIIGSRKPIMFVEGEKGSYDYEVYQYVFPNYTIIPRGNCEKVIESTKALKSNVNLHTIDARGLIDRDYRSEEEIENLRKAGIIFADVAEVENLLCCPEIITIVAQNQAKDVDEAINSVKNFVIEHLANDFEREVSFRSALEINFKLNNFNQKAVGVDNLKGEIKKLVDSINVEEIFAKNRKIYQKIIDEKDLVSALKNYTNKGLLPNMSRLLGLANGEYPKLVLRLLKTDKKAELVDSLKKYIEEI